MPRFQSPVQKVEARAKRQRMSPAQRVLWQHLRAHRFMGLQVRRLAPIGPYIVDFIIPSQRLVIIIDVPCDQAAAVMSYLTERDYRTTCLASRDVLSTPSAVLARLTLQIV